MSIKRDYLGGIGDLITPLFGVEFKLMFRLSRGRFEVLMQDVMAGNFEMFKSTEQDGESKASLEARLLLPLKTLAYGVPPHTFIDYFQMSQQFARDLCKAFDNLIIALYLKDFLRLPTAADLKKTVQLHHSVHKVNGIVGSLDCTHTYWKNCPKAWQGSFKGKEDKPSIVLEAVADYNLFFWHASYGYTGNLNDITILSLSPLLDRMTDGSFHALEEEAGVLVPFDIGEEQFHKVFMLVDGIYPSYSRFVRGMKQPVHRHERLFTQWQESARKDVERAFGVLKGTWQFLERPVLLHNLEEISNRVQCCLILHNILVTDRVMDGPNYTYRMQYDPAAGSFLQPSAQVQQLLLNAIPTTAGEQRSQVGVAAMNPRLAQAIAKADRFKELDNKEENLRLHQALMQYLQEILPY